jgi:CheY-like chemotaxis protein
MPDVGDPRESKTGEKQAALRSVRPDRDSRTVKIGLVVLLVDDNHAAVTLTAATVRRLGCRTFLAGDGEKALRILESQSSIDVVVTDVDMPQVDGLELLRRIKQSARLKDLTVILCSGHADPETMKRAAENGCALCLLKKMKMKTNAELIHYAIKNGLVD